MIKQKNQPSAKFFVSTFIILHAAFTVHYLLSLFIIILFTCILVLRDESVSHQCVFHRYNEEWKDYSVIEKKEAAMVDK